MKMVWNVMTIVYALLCVFAAAAQIKTESRRDTPVMMLAGSALLALAVCMPGRLSAALICLAGGLLVGAAAFLNGRRSGQFHAHHHIIRLALTLLLVVGHGIL